MADERTRGLGAWGVPGAVALVLLVGSSAVLAAQPRGAGTPPSPPNAPYPFQEQLPPVGKGNLFSEEQISYCLAQSIRIEALRSLVNRYKKAQVEYFNALTADFNSRCESYRYLGEAREAAKAAVEGSRSQIEDDTRTAYAKRFPAEDKVAAPSKPVAEPKAKPRVPQESASPAAPLAEAGPAQAERVTAAPPSPPPEAQPRVQPQPPAPAVPSTEVAGDKAERTAAGPPSAVPKSQSRVQQESPPTPAPPAEAAADKAGRAAAGPAPAQPQTQPRAQQEPASSAAPPAQAGREQTNQAAASPPTPAVKPSALPATKPEADINAALDRFVREVRRASWQIIDQRGYPEGARDKGWEGIAQIDVRFAAGGYIKSINLGESSGYPLLDDRALAIARSLRFPIVPAELQSREFAVRFPIAFRRS
jgi:TonB family protein